MSEEIENEVGNEVGNGVWIEENDPDEIKIEAREGGDLGGEGAE